MRALPLRPHELASGGLCLITGASGFIGGRLARRLARGGYDVRCLTRSGSDTASLDQLETELVIGDLRDSSSLARAVEGCRYVFHCGALVSDWARRQEISSINVAGTRSLLEASVEASIERFIHISTTDVYGYPDRPQTDETYAGTRFRNWYAQTKLEAEGEVRRAHADLGIDAVILRPATVYGPGSRELVGEIARAIRARHMLLIDGGRAVAGLCYVENLLDAVLLALGSSVASGRAFNITDGLTVTWREFTDDLAAGLDCPSVRWSLPYPTAIAAGFVLEHGYRMLRGATGLTAAPLLSRQAVQVLGKGQDFSNRRARQELGWEPRVGYEDGLRATLDWLLAEYLN